MAEKELTPEELEEIRKKEARKDKLHQNYLKQKANGKQKEYEERTRARKKGVYHLAGDEAVRMPRAVKQVVL